MLKGLRVAIVAHAVTAGCCLALPTFLISNNDALLRVSDAGVESFPLAHPLRAATYDPLTNNIFAVGVVDADGLFPMFRIANAETGSPTLVPIARLANFYGSITKVGPDFYGTSEGRLMWISIAQPEQPVEQVVGFHRITNTGGLGYDRAAEVLYMTSSDTDTLYRLDLETADPTAVGPLGMDMVWNGMEWWGGVMYTAAHNGTAQRFELGRIDQQSGAYTRDIDLGELENPAAVALAIIPEPASWMCLLAGGWLLRRRRATALVCAAGASIAAQAADWNNSGGNAGRNGQTREVGPDAATVAWSGGRNSIIAWQPVIEDGRVFLVRQSGFPPEQTGSPVIAMNVHTGAELWRRDLPANSGDWTTWVAGARDGRVYAARSGNGASVAAVMYALDATSGATVWTSQDTTRAGAYDGVVFAENGDLIVADFANITRIRASDGTTAWRVTRLGSVSGQCGACMHGDAIYIADAAPGGHVIRRHDANTGAFQYQSPVMAGFTLQNTPMVAPDGTIYLSRTQNNATVDFFYAINDDGAALTIRWSVPARWTVVSEFAVGPDNSVYMMAPGNVIKRLHPADGSTLAESEPIDSDANAQPRMAVDAEGRLFLCNGSFTNGRFFSFNDDLSPRWDVAVPNSNIGSPAIGCDGTLVIAGIGTSVRAFRTSRCASDLDADGQVALGDLTILLSNFGILSGLGTADGDSGCDGGVDLADLALLLSNFGMPCP